VILEARSSTTSRSSVQAPVDRYFHPPSAETTTTVTSTDNPSMPGQPVTFNAHVASKWGDVQEGHVNLTIDGRLYDWCSGGVSDGVAAFSPDCYEPSVLGPGPHTVSAAYVPSTHYMASSGSTEHVVRTEVQPTVTSVRSSDPTSEFRQPVTFSASVTSMGKAMPTGDVQFAVDEVAMGSPVALSNGVATSESIENLALGTRKVTATYLGSTSQLLAASEGSLEDGQLVTSVPTTTYAIALPNPYDKSISLTPKFSVFVMTRGEATGQVNLSIGSTDYHAELHAGVAEFYVPPTVINVLPLGDNVVNAQYLSDSPAFQNSSYQIHLQVK